MNLIAKNSYYVGDNLGVPWFARVDVNRDGLQDFVYYSNSTRSYGQNLTTTPESFLTIFEQTTDGLFLDATSRYIPGNVSPIMGVSLSLGDLNRDGTLDFILGGSGWDPYIDGKPASDDPKWVRGEPDLFFMSSPNSKWLTFNTGVARPWTHDVAVGDINQDGFDDVFSSSISWAGDYNSFFSVFSEGNSFGLVKNNIPQELSEPSFQKVDYSTPTYIKDGIARYTARKYTGSLLFDANGDGYSDLALFAQGETKTNIIYFNDGHGNFAEDQSHELPAGTYGWGGHVGLGENSYIEGTTQLEGRAADIDQDGDQDILFISNHDSRKPTNYQYYNGSTLEILENDGSGSFSLKQRIELIPTTGPNYTFHHSIELVDLNRDGQIDVVLQGVFHSPDFFQTELLINHGGHFVRETEIYLDEKNARFLPYHQDGNLHFLKHEYQFTGQDPVYKTTVGSIVLSNYLSDQKIGSIIAGHAEAEYLLGSNGSDGFIMSGGSDAIDGLGGVDTLIVSAQKNDVTLSFRTNFVEVRYMNQITSAYDIERLKFSDTNLALDIDGIAGQAYRIYKAAFDRSPDLKGLGYWINDMDNGASLTNVSAGFIASQEFQSRYGDAVSDADFIRLLYANVLDRTPDQKGLDYWINDLKQGLTRAAALASFSESNENKTNVANLIANGIEYTNFIG